MKKLLLTFCLSAFLLGSGHSQTVNDVPLSEIDVDYIQIIGTDRMMSNRVTVRLDFGQLNRVWVRDTVIRDGNGNLVVFNSMIDALNFMSRHGYDFVQALINNSDSSSEYIYILKKKQPDPDQLIYGAIKGPNA